MLGTMRATRDNVRATDPDVECHIKDEIEFARAWTALLLAARLEDAEMRAEEAYRLIIGEPAAPRRRLFR